MSGSARRILNDPMPASLLSLLRHELVSPINLIVGYCELVIAEAADRGESALVGPLQPVRQLGFQMLRSVDQVLLHQPRDRSLADLKELARTLIVPAAQLVELCGAIALPPDLDSTAANLPIDLDRIRSAGSRMCRMAQDLAAGRFPSTDEPRTGLL